MLEMFSITTLLRLFQGFCITLEIAGVSLFFSIIGGVVLGVLMSGKNRLVYWICRFLLEFVRVMPLIVWLFVVYFGLSRWLNINLSAVAASIVVFSLWGVFEMMDLVRGAITSIPKHQMLSALSLGFSPLKAYFLIILPQSLKRLAPAAINLFTRLIKSTTFAFLIGAVELLKVGQQIIELNHRLDFAPFVIYGLIFWIYFLICYPLSKMARRLEKQ